MAGKAYVQVIDSNNESGVNIPQGLYGIEFVVETGFEKLKYVLRKISNPSEYMFVSKERANKLARNSAIDISSKFNCGVEARLKD